MDTAKKNIVSFVENYCFAKIPNSGLTTGAVHVWMHCPCSRNMAPWPTMVRTMHVSNLECTNVITTRLYSGCSGKCISRVSTISPLVSYKTTPLNWTSLLMRKSPRSNPSIFEIQNNCIGRATVSTFPLFILRLKRKVVPLCTSENRNTPCYW